MNRWQSPQVCTFKNAKYPFPAECYNFMPSFLIQEKCEAAYFVVVLHHLRSVVISVRGTETPEDLITDGLGRECLLSRDDLDGLIKHVLSRSLFLYLTRHTHTHTHTHTSMYASVIIVKKAWTSLPERVSGYLRNFC
jgi:hypothetical protein